MSDAVPTFQSLECYPCPSVQQPRYAQLAAAFEARYGQAHSFIARSPGRVNLIGEHIDYCQFAVLPLAIDTDVLLAVAPTNEGLIELANMDEAFEPRTIRLGSGFIRIDAAASDWANYFRCGLRVAHGLMGESTSLKGMRVLATGSVPAGGGLSSLAALVCALALAVLHANGVAVSKTNLTRITVLAEHYVGVNTGGMDQAASVGGMRNHALYVEFQPLLTARAFRFPDLEEPLAFLVANTLVTSNKHETAPTNYNLRVVEVSIAAVLLAKDDGPLVADGNLDCGTLRGAMDAHFGNKWDGSVAEGVKRLLAMTRLVDERLHPEAYTVSELCLLLGLSEATFHERFLTRFPVRFETLALHARAKHVYSEALRVLQALALLEGGASESFYQEFGALMDESQVSCSTLFNCSCPEITQVCEIARANGAAGSRLTGAGWGGCTVHLVPLAQVETVKAALVEQYYKVRNPKITEAELAEALVVSQPAWGSSIMEGRMW